MVGKSPGARGVVELKGSVEWGLRGVLLNFLVPLGGRAVVVAVLTMAAGVVLVWLVRLVRALRNLMMSMTSWVKVSHLVGIPNLIREMTTVT